jgi:VanZ family protein
MRFRLWSILTVASTVLLSGVILVMGVAPTVPKPLRIFNDKVLHASGYGVLGFLATESLAVLRWGPTPPLGGAAYAVLHGATLEAMQSLTPTRDAEWGDVLADAVGGSLGAGLWLLWRRR